MHIGMILEMAADGLRDRVCLGPVGSGLTFGDLGHRSRRAATFLSGLDGDRIVMIDENSEAVPIALFGAVIAGKPFVPLNYRLADDQLRSIVARNAPAVVIAGDGIRERLGQIEGIHILDREHLLTASLNNELNERDGWDCDPDGIAVLLFTSGTTGEPKAAVLRHRNLASYLMESVEFGSSAVDDCAIVGVPPYHIAAISSILSNTYAGRRVIQLRQFDPVTWVDTVRRESVTNAMVIPTMLRRILDVIAEDGGGLPTLRSMAYGGGPMPLAVVERALEMMPDVDFVNAYGLTETSSTISILDPEAHRTALASDDPATRTRLGSVGRPLSSVEISIRNPLGDELPTGVVGEIWVRGAQVSGEYLGLERSGPGAAEGWFNTRDSGHLDADGFLYLQGRVDDVIVRGGENLSPGEIEEVLQDHPAVDSAVVVGIPDLEWGESVVAAVVLEPHGQVSEAELREFVRARLRSARTPEHIVFRDELPHNETGKLLRRVIKQDLAEKFPTD